MGEEGIELGKILTMERRTFIRNSVLGVAGSAITPNISFAEKYQWFPKKKVITISYNVYQFKGYPETDDTKFMLRDIRPQMPDRMALELELYQPHIVTFQEAPKEQEVKKVAESLGMNYAYFPGGYPGALLTKFEIKSSENCPLESLKDRGELFSRHWGKAILKSPTEEIILYSIHLHPSNDSIRKREVHEILQVMNKDMSNGKSIIFQGDFNHEPIQDEYNLWKETGLIDCYVKKGVEQRNTIKSIFPKRTVDYIWVNKKLEDRLLRCKVLFEGNFRTNPMDARSIALSDHLPVMAEFQ